MPKRKNPVFRDLRLRRLGSRAGESTPPIITQDTPATFGPYVAGDTPEDAYTAGTYLTTIGTIDTVEAVWTINGSPALGTDVLAEDDVVGLSELVTNTNADERTFSYGTTLPAGAAPDVTAPTISSTSPADNATGVSATVSPTITFDEDVVFGTGLITLRQNDGGWADLETFNVETEVGTGNGQVSISGNVLTINPTASLTSSREYAIRIAATAIDDTSGNSFAGITNDTTISFTAADTVAPTISSTSPADNATGVADTVSPTITFDEPVVFGTGLITLRENDGGWADLETFDVTSDVGTGNGQVSISGAVLTINPTASLTAEREYAIRIAATAIDDTSGNSFAGVTNDTTISFTVAPAGVAPVITGTPLLTDNEIGVEGDLPMTFHYTNTSSATPPSAATIKAAPDSRSLSSDENSLTGLTQETDAGTWYFHYLVSNAIGDSDIETESYVVSAAFDPADLAGAEVVLDFSDITTLFQAADGTTPITASNQRIGSVLNRGTKGGYFNNTGGSQRPLYLESGGRKYGKSDATDAQYLRLDLASGDPFDMSGGFWLWILFNDAEWTEGTPTRAVLSITSPSTNAPNNDNGLIIYTTDFSTDPVAVQVSAGLSNSAGFQSELRDTRTINMDWGIAEFECIPTASSPNGWLRVEKSADAGTPVDIANYGTTGTGYPDGATSAKLFTLFANSNGGSGAVNGHMKAEIAAVVMVTGTLTTDERNDVREWLRTRGGF